jgi:hypothetical protein
MIFIVFLRNADTLSASGFYYTRESETPVCAITLMGAINITMNKNGHFD